MGIHGQEGRGSVGEHNVSSISEEASLLIDFNVHQVPTALGLSIPPNAAAAMIGITESEFELYCGAVDDEIREIAASLLKHPDLAAAVRSLPVPAGGTMMTVGDSITTYRRGYARILEAMISLARPAEEIRFLNVAQSGYHSADGLESVYTQFVAERPDWVSIKFGVNDSKLFGDSPERTLISAEEYQSNMAAIVKAFLSHTKSRPVLITPTPVVEDVVREHPDFKLMHVTWSNSDIEARAATVRQVADTYGLICVDAFGAFGDTPDPGLFLDDGLHPGPTGHERIIRELLGALPASPNQND